MANLSGNIDFEKLGLIGQNPLATPSNATTGMLADDAIAEPTVAERVGRLEARGIDDATICDMFQLTSGELIALRMDKDYGVALSTGHQNQTERPLQIDDSWDDVENTALNKLRGSVANEYDSDRLLKIASIANRATRRSERAKPGMIDASQNTTNVVQVAFSPTFIQQLQAINPNKEHERVADMAKGNKMVDFLPQGQFEKLIKDEVNNNAASEFEDAVAMLDNMVLGA